MLPSACGLWQHFQDLGHSVLLYGPPSRQITYIHLICDKVNLWHLWRHTYSLSLDLINRKHVYLCITYLQRESPTIEFVLKKLKHTVYSFQSTKKQWKLNQTVKSQRMCIKNMMLAYTMIIIRRKLVSRELVGVNWCDITNKWVISLIIPV